MAASVLPLGCTAVLERARPHDLVHGRGQPSACDADEQRPRQAGDQIHGVGAAERGEPPVAAGCALHAPHTASDGKERRRIPDAPSAALRLSAPIGDGAVSGRQEGRSWERCLGRAGALRGSRAGTPRTRHAEVSPIAASGRLATETPHFSVEHAAGRASALPPCFAAEASERSHCGVPREPQANRSKRSARLAGLGRVETLRVAPVRVRRRSRHDIGGVVPPVMPQMARPAGTTEIPVSRNLAHGDATSTVSPTSKS